MGDQAMEVDYMGIIYVGLNTQGLKSFCVEGLYEKGIFRGKFLIIDFA